MPLPLPLPVRRLRFVALLLLPGLALARSCPDGLRIAFLDTYLPPYLTAPPAREAAPVGLAVDWTRSALRRLGCEAELLRLPQRRLLADLAEGLVHLTPGIGYNAERAQRYAFPLRADGSLDARLSIGDARLSLFVLREQRDAVRWDGERLEAAELRVGVVASGVEEPLAVAKGWPVETSLNHALNAEKLRRGRLPVVLMPHLALDRTELDREPAMVELQPPVLRTHFYAPANRDFAARQSRFVQQFWLELCKASRSHFRELPACS